jgi:hypothetical protein
MSIEPLHRQPQIAQRRGGPTNSCHLLPVECLEGLEERVRDPPAKAIAQLP